MEKAFNDYLAKHNYERFDLKALLFDMDGVLYDSMKWHAKSWHETMTEYGLNSTYDEFYQYEGMVGFNTINHIIKRERGREATEEEKKEMYKRKSDLFFKYNDNSLIPFAYDFVKMVHDEGMECVVVTGSGQASLLEKIESNFPGLFKRDEMVTAWDVKYGKPHPEPYLMGLKKAGDLQPNQAIVVENAPRGIEAAVAAGIFTIAINTGPLTEQSLRDAGANIVLPSMEALYNNWESYYKELTSKRVDK
ncbi:HAD family phosphatase [Dysgonomonas sp. 25]|uniref:HAD family hydrolase n=1 Tax=Dysgonomonas sp. 25 TaxID=2302933 RepID=UPI0013D05789|nr:HAD-IA family hydrolase [Dysgonomonas sp. 25]NDV69527.1 HAD family hydrolase [Dysgonomonas sp. 25]